MVQFNLLPDVKIEYIKTQSRMRVIVAICSLVSIILLAIFLLLFMNARVLQPAHMKRVTADINADVKKVQSVQDIDKILTIQKQLDALSGLHDTKIISSRLPTYLTVISPSSVKYTDIDADFTTNVLTLKGTAPDLATVNKYVDTMKFTTYRVAGSSGKQGPAFSQVVLKSFSIQEKPQNAEEKATYEISMKFDTELFKRQKVTNTPEEQAVSLQVPNIISTRSETERPVFTEQPKVQETR